MSNGADRSLASQEPREERARPLFQEAPGEAAAQGEAAALVGREAAPPGPPLDRMALARLDTGQQARVLEGLQRGRGNTYVQRLLAVQRQDAGPRDATPAVGTPAPATGTPSSGTGPAKPTFIVSRYISGGPRFDATYTPVGPLPQVGTFEVELKVHINFKDFTRAMMRQEPYRSHRFTREQLRDFAWKPAERTKFSADFQSSVASAWSAKHSMVLRDPSFSEYKANVSVKVTVVGTPDQAHTKITAQKVPAGAPRFRSFVSGDEATLDIRDPSEPETRRNETLDYVRQVGPFGFDSAEITPEIQSQITTIESDLRRVFGRDLGSSGLHERWHILFTGRASAKGSVSYNKALGERRAEAVGEKINQDLNLTQYNLRSKGEEHASEDERFQRVDVEAHNTETNRPDLTQNVAAHEAGHMFGLGDEYIEEKPGKDVLPKFQGDQPSHYGDVQSELGTDAANELLVQEGGSMMSGGSEVRRGHYVYFLQTLKSMTGRNWTVE